MAYTYCAPSQNPFAALDSDHEESIPPTTLKNPQNDHSATSKSVEKYNPFSRMSKPHKKDDMMLINFNDNGPFSKKSHAAPPPTPGGPNPFEHKSRVFATCDGPNPFQKHANYGGSGSPNVFHNDRQNKDDDNGPFGNSKRKSKFERYTSTSSAVAVSSKPAKSVVPDLKSDVAFPSLMKKSVQPVVESHVCNNESKTTGFANLAKDWNTETEQLNAVKNAKKMVLEEWQQKARLWRKAQKHAAQRPSNIVKLPKRSNTKKKIVSGYNIVDASDKIVRFITIDEFKENKDFKCVEGCILAIVYSEETSLTAEEEDEIEYMKERFGENTAFSDHSSDYESDHDHGHADEDETDDMEEDEEYWKKSDKATYW